MKVPQKVNEVRAIASDFSIMENQSGKVVAYGSSPYYDMLIENCVYCDFFREEVPEPSNFNGFDRRLYTLCG